MKRITYSSALIVALCFTPGVRADSTAVVVSTTTPVTLSVDAQPEKLEAESVSLAVSTDTTQTADVQVEVQAQLAQDQAEKQAERAEAIAEHTKKLGDEQAERAEQQEELAKAGVNRLSEEIDRSVGQAYSYSFGNSWSGHPERALVIRSTEADAKTLASAEEDLNIMGRILEKALYAKDGDEPPGQAMGINLVTFGRSGHPRNLLIEGYGALFLLSVNFPLVGPPAKPEETATNETSNSTWDEAKHELYGRPAGADQDPFYGHALPKDEFDAKRVENLKDSLLEALKNAANMRGLKSDEHVTVVITSGGGDHGGDVWKIQQRVGSFSRMGSGGGTGSLGGGVMAPKAVVTSRGPSAHDAGGSVLTLRVKKSDVDAYAKGKLTDEEFRNKAAILVY